MDNLTNDFIALFNAFWYRDFPVVEKHKPLGKRAEWTLHIGFCVRSCADLLGFFTHFETGNRTDAVIKDNRGNDLIHIEWEWSEPRDKAVNEIRKLSESSKGVLSILITYSFIDKLKDNLDSIREQWSGDDALLIFIITCSYDTGSGRIFENIETFSLKGGRWQTLRTQPALPWKCTGKRWETGQPDA